MAKHKPADETPENQPGTTVVGDADLPVDPEQGTFEYDQATEHPLLTYSEALLLHGGGKVGGLIDVIGSLLQMGWIADALQLVRLLSDRTTTIGTLFDAIEAIIAKLQNKAPQPPKRLMAGKRPSKEDILKHLHDAGLNTSIIPPQILGMLISLAMQFGLPLIQKLIESLLNKQKQNPAMLTF